MQITRIGVRGALIGLFAVAVIGMIGCAGGPLREPCGGGAANALPSDLPPDPDPSKKYCRVWVPPTYRKTPKLVQCRPGCEKPVEVQVMETEAYDVMVRPRGQKCATTCGKTCNESLVQVKPGGYRWENSGGCWQYTYRAPQYKWCPRTVKEEGIGYCVETPAEWKTVVETRPVTKVRSEYVPPEYRVRWVNEVFTPGHWEWQSSQGCACTADRREWSRPRVHAKQTVGCPPPKRTALDCGCPPTN